MNKKDSRQMRASRNSRIFLAGLFTFLFFLSKSLFLSAWPGVMSHQVNNFNGDQNPEFIYVYRNVYSLNYKAWNALDFFLVNVLDYETETGVQPMNRPLFGGGRTNSLFTGMTFFQKASFSLALSDASIWFYGKDAQYSYMNVLYLEPLFNFKLRTANGFLYFTLRLRQVYYITPFQRYDFRQKLEIWSDRFQGRIQIFAGDEISVNLQPGALFQTNDLYAGALWKIISQLSLFATLNWEQAGSENYFNFFGGVKFTHQL
jgi:hypothetical protein